jgi:hypothetical protein
MPLLLAGFVEASTMALGERVEVRTRHAHARTHSHTHTFAREELHTLQLRPYRDSALNLVRRAPALPFFHFSRSMRSDRRGSSAPARRSRASRSARQLPRRRHRSAHGSSRQTTSARMISTSRTRTCCSTRRPQLRRPRGRRRRAGAA